eukprot:24553-Pleurochrysis_carterae.AAC.2
MRRPAVRVHRSAVRPINKTSQELRARVRVRMRSELKRLTDVTSAELTMITNHQITLRICLAAQDGFDRGCPHMCIQLGVPSCIWYDFMNIVRRREAAVVVARTVGVCCI